jgi:iron complex outermembrane receptor protein
MKPSKSILALAIASAFATGVQAQETLEKQMGTVIVTGNRPTSLPTQIPTTIEGITAAEIARTINATDAEDALKYLPSLLVRKRYIGDYNHAVLSTRASGTGNSARSAVYADGILLSNYLGNGATFAPRWGMVTPSEIERVDVLYGPFSAAYGGNSVGAVVDYVTRMPRRFEAHARLSLSHQPFRLYNTRDDFNGHQGSVSLGNRQGAWSWFIDLSRNDSDGQPQTFVTRLPSAGAATNAPDSVSGAVPGQDRSYRDWLVFGTATQYHTVQDHLKAKLAYDFSPTLRATYVLGLWRNESEGRPESYLRNGSGQPVYSGPVTLGGRRYTLGQTDFNVSNEELRHVMHGLSVKSNTKGVFDWELAASLYDYDQDLLRAATVAVPGALTGGAGRIVDGSGTGWNTFAAKGVWRPGGACTSSNSATSAKPTSWPASRTPPRTGSTAPRRTQRGFRRTHPDPGPVCPGHLALRARLEGRARSAPGALGRERRPHGERDRHRDASRTQRKLRVAESGAGLAGHARLDTEGLARARGAHADRVRALPGRRERRGRADQ